MDSVVAQEKTLISHACHEHAQKQTRLHIRVFKQHGTYLFDTHYSHHELLILANRGSSMCNGL